MSLSSLLYGQVQKKPALKETKTTAGAKGTFAADMDCLVKLNGSVNPLSIKAFAPVTIPIKVGDNAVEAIASDKKSNFRTTAKGIAGETVIVEISFFDDSKFLEYVKQGNLQMVETAVKKNPELISNKVNNLVTSPLEIAIIHSQPLIAAYLLDKGMSYTVPKNIYPLHKAAMYGSSLKSLKKKIFPADSVLVDLFLAKGCDVNEPDEAGYTPLHSAVKYGKADLVKLLIEKGASVNAKNVAGETPLKLAEDKGYITIIDFLKTKGALEK